MNNIAVIFDREKIYGEKLAGYFNSNNRFMFDVIAFHEKEELNDFCMDNTPKLLLVSEKDKSLIKEMQFDETIILSDRCTQKAKGESYIFKYQSAEKLEKDIIGFLSDSEKIGAIVRRKNRLRMISVYSPGYSPQVIRNTLELGKQLSKRHKTLVVDMEAHSAIKGMIGKDFSRDLTDIIYFIESKGGNIGLQLAGLIEHFGDMDILPAPDGQTDLCDISFEQWKELLERIEYDTDYEYIIFHLSDGIRGLYELMEISDLVITPVPSDEISSFKLTCYESYLNNIGIKGILEKTQRTWEISDD